VAEAKMEFSAHPLAHGYEIPMDQLPEFRDTIQTTIENYVPGKASPVAARVVSN
jgi:hypothetical protein